MTPENTKRTRRQAVVSAACSAAALVLSAVLALMVRSLLRLTGLLSAAALLWSAGNLICLIPLSFCLRERLCEIKGGEEYEARQY